VLSVPQQENKMQTMGYAKTVRTIVILLNLLTFITTPLLPSLALAQDPQASQQTPEANSDSVSRLFYESNEYLKPLIDPDLRQSLTALQRNRDGALNRLSDSKKLYEEGLKKFRKVRDGQPLDPNEAPAPSSEELDDQRMSLVQKASKAFFGEERRYNEGILLRLHDEYIRIYGLDSLEVQEVDLYILINRIFDALDAAKVELYPFQAQAVTQLDPKNKDLGIALDATGLALTGMVYYGHTMLLRRRRLGSKITETGIEGKLGKQLEAEKGLAKAAMRAEVDPLFRSFDDTWHAIELEVREWSGALKGQRAGGFAAAKATLLADVESILTEKISPLIAGEENIKASRAYANVMQNAVEALRGAESVDDLYSIAAGQRYVLDELADAARFQHPGALSGEPCKLLVAQLRAEKVSGRFASYIVKRAVAFNELSAKAAATAESGVEAVSEAQNFYRKYAGHLQGRAGSYFSKFLRGVEIFYALEFTLRMVTKAISKIPADDPEKSRAPQWIKDLHDAVNNYDVFDHSNGYTPDILNPTNSHHPLLAWWYVSDLNEAEKERHKLERMLHDVQKAMAAAEKSTTSSSTPLSLQEFNDPKEEMLLGSEGILPFLTPSLPAGLSYDLVSNLPKLRVRMPLDPKQLVKENLPAQTSPVPLKK
jgi:hypothetical protein